MTRPEFLAALIGGATAVKAVAETTPEGTAPKTKRLLVIEFPDHLSTEWTIRVKDCLKRYEERYGVEFMVLSGGARIVDPSAPIDNDKILDSLGKRPRGLSPHVEDVTNHSGAGWKLRMSPLDATSIESGGKGKVSL